MARDCTPGHAACYDADARNSTHAHDGLVVFWVSHESRFSSNSTNPDDHIRHARFTLTRYTPHIATYQLELDCWRICRKCTRDSVNRPLVSNMMSVGPGRLSAWPISNQDPDTHEAHGRVPWIPGTRARHNSTDRMARTIMTTRTIPGIRERMST